MGFDGKLCKSIKVKFLIVKLLYQTIRHDHQNEVFNRNEYQNKVLDSD